MIAMLVAVTVFSGSPPEFKVIPNGVFSPDRCDSEAALRSAGPPTQTDSQGRVVMLREFKCILLNANQVAEMEKTLQANP